jgi:hypothetical protein
VGESVTGEKGARKKRLSVKKTAEVYALTLYRPLGCTDLYRQLLAVARAALMDGNRCALASAIASILTA